jgi:hypothetical protein
MADIPDTGGDGLLKSLRGTAARLAYENDRLADGKAIGIERRERLIDRAWDVSGHEFMRLAHVDNSDRVVMLARDKVVVGDLGRRSHQGCLGVEVSFNSI